MNPIFFRFIVVCATGLFMSCIPRRNNQMIVNSDLQKVEFISSKVSILERFSSPIVELSGLSWLCGQKQNRTMMAIGDKNATLAIQNLEKNTLTSVSTPNLAVQVHALDSALTSANTQFEAVACDKSSIFLLSEKQSKIAILDIKSMTPKALIHLDVAGSKIASQWELNNSNNNGEGFVLLKNGHILVTKEKQETVLLEFAPSTETNPVVAGFATLNAVQETDDFPLPALARKPDGIAYKLIKIWSLGESSAQATEDISELAVGPNNTLYVLSDQSNTIAEVKKDDTQKLRYERVWKLPKEIQKAEGLVFDEQGHPYVGIDGAKLGATNLYKLDLLPNR